MIFLYLARITSDQYFPTKTEPYPHKKGRPAEWPTITPEWPQIPTPPNRHNELSRTQIIIISTVVTGVITLVIAGIIFFEKYKKKRNPPKDFLLDSSDYPSSIMGLS